MPEIKVVIESEALGAAEEAARAARVDFRIAPETHLVDPFTVIFIGGGVLLIGKFVVDLIDRLKGGVVIDLRNGTPAIRRDKAIPFGWVTIVAADGSVKIEVHDAPKDAAERLLEKIVAGGLSTAKAIGEAAVKELGSGKVEQ